MLGQNFDRVLDELFNKTKSKNVHNISLCSPSMILSKASHYIYVCEFLTQWNPLIVFMIVSGLDLMMLFKKLYVMLW